MSAVTIITSEGPALTKTWHSTTEKPMPGKPPYRYRFEERKVGGLAGIEALLAKSKATR